MNKNNPFKEVANHTANIDSSAGLEWMFNEDNNNRFGKPTFEDQKRRVNSAIYFMLKSTHNSVRANAAICMTLTINDASELKLPAGVAPITTMAVDHKNNLYIDINFVSRLSIADIIPILFHEVYHVTGLHSARGSHFCYTNRSKKGYTNLYNQFSNMVCDMWCDSVMTGTDFERDLNTSLLKQHRQYVTDMVVRDLQQYKCTVQLPHDLSNHCPIELTNEIVCNILDNNPDAGSGDAGSGDAGSGDAGSGDAGSGDAGSGSGDTHVIVDPDIFAGKSRDEAANMLEKMAKDQAISLEGINQNLGINAGTGCSRRSGEFDPTDTPLVVAIQGGTQGSDYSFPRFDNSAAMRGAILPTRAGSRRNICILLDVSGSVMVRPEHRNQLGQQIIHIANSNKINSVVLACYESRVGYHDIVVGKEIDLEFLSRNCKGFGGTSFNRAIEWCNTVLVDTYPEVQEVFHLTDGHDRLSNIERVLPMTWLSTGADTSQLSAASGDTHILLDDVA